MLERTIRFSEIDRHVPENSAGIYEILTDEGVPLKVGISVDMKERLRQHKVSRDSGLKLKEGGRRENPSDVTSKKSILAKHLYYDEEITQEFDLKTEEGRQSFLEEHCRIAFEVTETKGQAREIEKRRENTRVYRYKGRVHWRRQSLDALGRDSLVSASCPYTNGGNKLEYWRYTDGLHSDGKTLILIWFTRAFKQRNCKAIDSFEPFISCWIAFNAWATCVTREERDAAMVRKVGNCPELRGVFDEFLGVDDTFRSHLSRFARFWPVASAFDIEKLEGRLKGLDRKARVPQFRSERVRFSPRCWASDHEKLDWPHTVHTIYRVRCNLFHGGKSPRSESDAVIVKSSFDVLLSFMARMGEVGLMQLPNGS